MGALQAQTIPRGFRIKVACRMPHRDSHSVVNGTFDKDAVESLNGTVGAQLHIEYTDTESLFVAGP
jgi:hypothetical protein